MILACLIGRGVRVAAGVVRPRLPRSRWSLWPIATAGHRPAAGDEPWIWYLVNIATLAAVLAFPLPAADRLDDPRTRCSSGSSASSRAASRADFWVAVGLDVSFALILGGVILTLGWLFRSVAANVDETRARAVASYARAAAADAAEQERVAVAALMHDSVLAALIAAERAEHAA